MRETFRFWGYGPDVFARVVGQDGPVTLSRSDQPTAMFGRVELHPEFAPRCGPLTEECTAGWLTWLIADRAKPSPSKGEPVAWLTAEDGGRRTLIARDAKANYHFEFDLDRSLSFLQHERYFQHEAPAYVRMGINPARLPGWVRRFGFGTLNVVRKLRRPKGAMFPVTPHDPSVDVWRYVVRSFVEDATDAQIIPLWPDGKAYAVTLSHDLDTDYAFRHRSALDALRDIEETVAMRSAWMIVTKHLGAGCDALGELVRGGHEIGFHGTRHDHKLAFLSPERMARRIREGRRRLAPFAAVGFRSPNYLRTATMYNALSGRFEYDMSMHDVVGDTSGMRRANEGCCTCLPFIIEGTDVLEIPTTVPKNWEFNLRGVSPEDALAAQVRAVGRIKSIGGVANILTHPDPGLSLRPSWLGIYRSLLDQLQDDGDAWFALPRDVNRHWRERQRRIDSVWRATEAAPTSIRNPYTRVVGAYT